MLKKENRIFKNLYNEFGWEIENSIKLDDWKDTKNLISKGREWIINEVKTSIKRKRRSRIFNWFKMVICSKRSWFKTTLFSN